ncbi:SCO2400 family protein [Streptomyces marianii]|uniref:Uncharacterized protein n=1 Tax=Streptomyces marianii TaxID=1817406 RepID=A0A5R9E7V6_9ACTN|nr:hypothetical protein [Streptomyces marianii]TLQ46131.1 hypothetical protein FEF34_26865 [Streptomyces marianii]
MDYCVPCHRTLNGAVTCPECGAYDPAMADADGVPPSATPMAETCPGEETAPGGPPAAAPAPAHAAPPATADTATPPGLTATTPLATASDRRAETHVADAHRPRPRRWRTYGGRTLAAAAFAVLGGLGTSSLLANGSTDLPRAAPSPELPSPDGSREPGTAGPTASAAPERPATHPARGAARESNGAAPSRPRTTPATPEPPAVPTPEPAPDTASPPVTAGPSARPSTGGPAPSPSPTAPTSPSPSGSTGASPTGSPTPGTTEVPVTEALPKLAPLPASVSRNVAAGAALTGR